MCAYMRVRVCLCVCEEFRQMKKGCYRIQKIVERLLSFKIAICAIVVPASPCAFVRKRNNSTLVFFRKTRYILSRQTHRSISPHDKHNGQYPLTPNTPINIPCVYLSNLNVDGTEKPVILFLICLKSRNYRELDNVKKIRHA